MQLHVTSASDQGGRPGMEDRIRMGIHRSSDIQGDALCYSYFGVFDGHGGTHAAEFAKEHLMNEIKKQKGFFSKEERKIIQAIRDGFLSVHQKMSKSYGKLIF